MSWNPSDFGEQVWFSLVENGTHLLDPIDMANEFASQLDHYVNNHLRDYNDPELKATLTNLYKDIRKAVLIAKGEIR